MSALLHPTASLLARLRADTAAHHARAEACNPVLAPTLAVAGYAHVLRAMHAPYAAWERAIAGWMRRVGGDALPWPDPVLGLAARGKARWLARDLDALGEGVAGAPLPDGLAPPAVAAGWPATSADVVGVLYVMEGATLGGQIVHRALGPRLGLTPERGLAFYTAYGAATGPMWRAFVAMVAAYEARRPVDGERVVAAACQAFDVVIAQLTAAGAAIGATPAAGAPLA
jgi:heme oxygenase